MKNQKPKSAAKDFPVVCVGGSAGGLDAYTRLLQNMPADMGVAIVIVNHLRNVATLLHEILPRYTKMSVELITERLDVQPNHVFIIPAQRDLHIKDDEFHLKPISKPRGWPDVITVFLRSLTKQWDGKLIAVIVSGYDGDGADALCGIKEVGGHHHRTEARYCRTTRHAGECHSKRLYRFYSISRRNCPRNYTNCA
jgi:two-component system, chemotaxis family, protein-glutamate methylesterase/glutaminase